MRLSFVRRRLGLPVILTKHHACIASARRGQ